MFEAFITEPGRGSIHSPPPPPGAGNRFLVVGFTNDVKVEGNLLLHRFRTDDLNKARLVHQAWHQGHFGPESTRFG